MNNTLIFSVLVLSSGLVIMVNIIGFTQVSGFFHDPKPEPPKLAIDLPPFVQEALDKLYSKHPHITQYDIDLTHAEISTKCADSPEHDNPSVSMFVCTAMSSGVLGGYLENLGYTFIDPTPMGKGPQLAQ